MPGVGKHEQSGIAQVLFEDEGVDCVNDDVVGESLIAVSLFVVMATIVVPSPEGVPLSISHCSI